MNVDPRTLAESQRSIDESRRRLRRLAGWIIVATVAALMLISGPIGYLGAEVVGGVAGYLLITAITVVVAVTGASALGRVIFRRAQDLDKSMAALHAELADSLSAVQAEAAKRAVVTARQDFERQLTNALEMSEDEGEVVDVIERSLSLVSAGSASQVLLADNSHAHLEQVATVGDHDESHRCRVQSPDECPAARRAQVLQFSDSESLDACPKLRGRGQPRSATCVPVSIMGRTVGVIHTSGEVGEVAGEAAVGELSSVANLVGARLGFLRVMAETQLQAATDSLTGLLNRRSMENQVRGARETTPQLAVVVADLDHFKRLNDTYGHETGDRALRAFASTFRDSLRREDLLCRHGGEEFVAAMPNCPASSARSALEYVRSELAAAIAAAGLPNFTASFGVVDISADETFAAAVNRADAALFAAKSAGRDRIVVHNQDGTEQPEASLTLATLLSTRRRTVVLATTDDDPDGPMGA